MTFEEKITWVSLAVSLVVPVAYFLTVMGDVGSVPVSEIAYQWPMIVAIVVSAVLIIVGAILTGVGTGISIELTGEGSVDDIGLKDERDVQIGRRGDLVGFYVAGVGMIGVLALTMLEYEYFWIANLLYLSFIASTIVGSIVKLVAYRRGF